VEIRQRAGRITGGECGVKTLDHRSDRVLVLLARYGRLLLRGRGRT
jgi:hypothetical protein